MDNLEKPKSDEEKRIDLYLRQKKMLEGFLERNAISKAQFDKSLNDLTEKWACKNIDKIQMWW